MEQFYPPLNQIPNLGTTTRICKWKHWHWASTKPYQDAAFWTNLLLCIFQSKPCDLPNYQQWQPKRKTWESVACTIRFHLLTQNEQEEVKVFKQNLSAFLPFLILSWFQKGVSIISNPSESSKWALKKNSKSNKNMKIN